MMSTTHIYTEIYVNEQSLPLLKYFAHIRTNHSYSNSNGIHSSNGTAVDLCSLSLSLSRPFECVVHLILFAVFAEIDEMEEAQRVCTWRQCVCAYVRVFLNVKCDTHTHPLASVLVVVRWRSVWLSSLFASVCVIVSVHVHAAAFVFVRVAMLF